MKKFFTLILVCFASVSLWAYDFESGNLYYNITDYSEHTVEVTYQSQDEYNYGNFAVIAIPETVNYDGTTYSVTSIGSYAFYYCSALTSITIPNNVTSIGSDAFYHCSALTSITIPNSVTSIESWAFSYCSALTSITIPNSVTSIGSSAFSYCSALTSVTIPNSVTSIESDAFQNCYSLTEILVDAANPSYSSENGILYNKDKSQIIYIPQANNATSITIPLADTLIDVSELYLLTKLENIFVAEGNTHYSSVDGVLYNKDKTVLISCPRKKQTVTIPNSVTSIESHAFYNCSALTSVTIPNSVTSIGEYAFYYCSALTSITIPNSVTSIGSSAFYNTRWYNNLPNGIVYINNVLYKYKGSMPTNTSIDIKDGTISISPSAFSGCSSLTSITIPNSVTSIGSYAFDDCSALTSITIPNSVTSIGNQAFCNCSALTSITIPNSVTSIGSSAFYNCSALTSINIPEGVKTIEYNTFSNCSALTSITWNAENCSDFTGNWNAPFYNIRSQITEFVFGDKVQHIPAYLCYGMTNVSPIKLPNSITSIGTQALYNVPILNETSTDGVIYAGSVLIGYQGEMPANTTIHVKEGTTAIYEKAFYDCKNITSITIPNSVTSIGSQAFYNCSALTSITIPNSVTSIGSQAFYNCSALTSINIPEGVKTIEYSTFYNCSTLKSITIPNSVTSIGDWAFYNCFALTSITIPNSVQSIGREAFYGCSALTSINIPEGVKTIEYNTFYNCSSLTSVTIPNSVTSIGSQAFYNCSALTSITIPKSVQSIGYNAFYKCSKVTSITWNAVNCSCNNSLFYNCSQVTEFVFGDKVQHIPAYLCQGMKQLTSITIPNSVTSIGSSAFENCSALTSINIPEGVKTIEYNTFSGCSALTSVTIPNSVTSIGSSAFRYCSALTSITIPNSVTSIGSYAFQYCSALTSITWNAVQHDDFTTNSYSDAFYEIRSQITEFIFGDDVEYIPAYICYGMNRLHTITFGKSINHIGYNAFNNCSSIESVIWNVTAYTNSSPLNAIASTIESFVIGDEVESIPANLCNSMNKLDSLTLPNSISHIGNNAFANIPGLLIYCENETPATIGSSVVNDVSQYFIVPDADIYKSAWPNYKDHIIDIKNTEKETTISAITDKSALHQSLGLNALMQIVKLKINGTINSYDIMMLRNQMPLLRELDLSEASIVANAYEYTDGYCSKSDTLTTQSFTGTGTRIATIILPKSLKYIATNTFNSQLKDLTILGGKLADAAFENSSIRSVTLSDDIKAIAPSAFKNCDKLEQVTMGNGVQTIGSSAFYDCDNLKQISLGDGVQTIGSSAFYSCNNLASVTLSNNLHTINQDAFYGCSALQTITLPETLETIGKYAFQGAGLRAITIPANVSSLGVGAFAGGSSGSSSYGYYSSATSNSKSSYSATSNYTSSSSTKYYYNYGGSLREVTIPKESKLKTIPSRAFEGNGSLTKLSILGDSITSIADVAFRRCALDTLILPPNLTSLSTLSFGYCTGLKFIAMPNSLTEIPHNAFVGCTNLNDIQFPRKLTHIGHHAFADCSNLSNVDIPGLVTSIGDYAFKDCNVNSVYSYLFDPFTIGQNTFSAYANANAILYVPNLEDTEMKYLYDTQWSQFLNRVRMDKSFEYDDFYANGDVVIGDQDVPLNGDPNANLNPGSGLVVEGDSIQNLGTVIINGETGDWASIIAGCNLNVDTLVLQFKVSGYQWHFFGFPFEIKISDILTDGNFVIYEYDGGIRAQRDTTGWKKLPDTQSCLYPGHGYIFQFDFAVDGYFSIKLNKPNFCKLVEFINLFIYPSSKPNNQNWNYVSNPLLAYFDINDLNYYGPITIWDVLSGTYQTYRPGDDEYYLSPYEAFFLQNANLTDDFALFFDKTKAMTKKQRDERINTKKQMPIKKADTPTNERSLINLIISDGTYTDQTRVVINPNASMDYELGIDAAKFLSTENVPQLFSYDAAHAMCAINERPMDNGTIQLGVQLPKSGTYSISAARMDTTFYLFDKQENITHDFQQGDYYFDATSGLNDQRFELVRSPKYVTTDIENATTTTITPTSDGLMIDGDGYIQIYSMTGVTMAEGQLSGHVQLPAGIYLVVCNGVATKHTVQ